MKRIAGFVRGLLKKIIILLIRGYQIFISPIMPGKCRFYPTCSTYFVQAVEKYGPFTGSLLGIKRLLKCHPFHEGGYDPLKSCGEKSVCSVKVYGGFE